MTAEYILKHFTNKTWPRWQGNFAVDALGATQRHLGNLFAIACTLLIGIRVFELWKFPQPLLLPTLVMATLMLYAFGVRQYMLVFL